MKISQMRSIAIEAYKINQVFGSYHGPKAYGNNWPSIVNESLTTSTGMNVDPSYGYNDIKLKLRPTARQIRFCDDYWDAHALLSEKDRKEVMQYLSLACHKDSKIAEYAAKNYRKDTNYKRHIDQILQKLIRIYLANPHFASKFAVDASRISEEKEENTEPMPKSPTYWRPGRFTINYTGPKFKTIRRPRKTKSKKRRNKQ